MLKQGSRVIINFLKEIKQGKQKQFRSCSLADPNKTETGTEYKNYNAILYGDNIEHLQDKTRIVLEDFGIDKNDYVDKKGEKKTGFTIFVFKFSLIEQDPLKELKEKAETKPIADDKLDF